MCQRTGRISTANYATFVPVSQVGLVSTSCFELKVRPVRKGAASPVPPTGRQRLPRFRRDLTVSDSRVAIPPGEAPPWVREKWVGIELPCRSTCGARGPCTRPLRRAPANRALRGRTTAQSPRTRPPAACQCSAPGVAADISHARPVSTGTTPLADRSINTRAAACRCSRSVPVIGCASS
jgi:hypothetical protein